MPRFFVTDGSLTEACRTACLLGEDARHIALSLRMAVGDGITLSDGEGREYACRLLSLSPERVEAEVLSVCESPSELGFPIHVYMAYPKGDKLEFVIEKAVELGAASVTPFLSSRCVCRPAADKEARRAERYRRIARAAAGQCGRAVLPTVGSPLDFDGMLAEAARVELALFCYEGEGTRQLPDLLRGRERPASVAVIIGSEGGFSPEEAEAARRHGLQLTGLGRRILRCETAPLVALSALAYQYDFGQNHEKCIKK